MKQKNKQNQKQNKTKQKKPQSFLAIYYRAT